MSKDENLQEQESDIHRFSESIFEDLTDWIETGLNDHLRYPIRGVEYLEKRKYALDDAVYREKKVVNYNKENSKLNGFPVLIEGEILCHDNYLKKCIGTVSLKMEFSYNFDEEVTKATRK